jgi:hypothetical protein
MPVILSQLFLAAIFLLAAVGKFRHPMVFLRSVLDFNLLPSVVVPWFAAALPGIEVACGLALVAGAFSRGRSVRAAVLAEAATWIVAALLAVFTIAIAVNLVRGREMECGCFDIIGTVVGSVIPFFAPHAVTWWTVLRDVVFLLPAVYLLRSRAR